MRTLAGGLGASFDYLVRARATLLDGVQRAPPPAYTRAFPLGLGSIRATLVHVAGAEWGYVEALRKGEVTAQEIRQSNPFTLERRRGSSRSLRPGTGSSRSRGRRWPTPGIRTGPRL